MTFMKEILDVMRNIFIDSLRRIDKFNIEGSKYLSLNIFLEIISLIVPCYQQQ